MNCEQRRAMTVERTVNVEGKRGAVTRELGGHQPATLLGADLIVVSPGVDSNLTLLVQARARGIRIWSEVELAYRATEAPFIGITGTNGKRTTTTLIGLMVERAGKRGGDAG